MSSSWSPFWNGPFATLIGTSEIAEVYRGAGDADKALDSAEKGGAAFPERPDRRLRLFLAEEYRRRDRHQDALRPCWLEFLDHPSLDNYKFLEEFARERRRLGRSGRERALRSIRRDPAAKPNPKRGNALVPFPGASNTRPLAAGGDFSLRAENGGRLAEDEREAAPMFFWLRLAEAKRGIEAGGVRPRVSSPGRGGHRECFPGHRYDDAVKLLERAARLQQALGRNGEFHRHLDALRKTHKAKRNLPEADGGAQAVVVFSDRRPFPAALGRTSVWVPRGLLAQVAGPTVDDILELCRALRDAIPPTPAGSEEATATGQCVRSRLPGTWKLSRPVL